MDAIVSLKALSGPMRILMLSVVLIMAASAVGATTVRYRTL